MLARTSQIEIAIEVKLFVADPPVVRRSVSTRCAGDTATVGTPRILCLKHPVSWYYVTFGRRASSLREISCGSFDDEAFPGLRLDGMAEGDPRSWHEGRTPGGGQLVETEGMSLGLVDPTVS